MRTNDFSTTIATFALLFVTTACGSSSPAAPSSASAQSAVAVVTPTNAIGGATIVGTVSGVSLKSAAGVRALGNTSLIVTVVGTNVSAAVATDGSFTLANVPASHVVLSFAGPGVDATVAIGVVGNDDRIQIAVTVSGTTATLDNVTSTTSPSVTVNLTGTVTSVTSGCPSITLTVSGTSVQTSGATTFATKSCADIVTGDLASVLGTRRSDGSVSATSVDVPRPTTPAPAPTPSPTPAATVTMNGTIDGLVGTCPSLSMSVSGTYVRTNASTTFSGKGCGDLKTGDAIGVAGSRQSDTTVLASTIVATQTPTPTSTSTVTVTGGLGTFSGPCPNLQMIVGGSSGKYVRTNASTTFVNKACADLKSGDVLLIVASNTGDNLGLMASTVTVTGSAPVPPPVPVTLTGTVTALGNSCPTLSMKVDGTYTLATAATTFSGKTCATLKVGDVVTVVGTHPADNGTVTATAITSTATTTVPPTVTMNGTIGGLAGSCPALSISIGSTYVRTNSATVFQGKSCGELKTGDAAGVAGATQSDGTILATILYVSKG